MLITGDIQGDINVYRLNREEDDFDHSNQTDKITRLLYPNGDKVGQTAEETLSENAREQAEEDTKDSASEEKMVEKLWCDCDDNDGYLILD